MRGQNKTYRARYYVTDTATTLSKRGTTDVGHCDDIVSSHAQPESLLEAVTGFFREPSAPEHLTAFQ
jgi:hypothetical protein